jgi:formamidopyrimidine-DNA glycosylase
MPELPDIVVYQEALERHLAGTRLDRVRVVSPFLLRSVDPPLDAVHGKVMRGFRRLGKRLVWELDEHLFIVLHLMIAGRLRWRPPGAKLARKTGLAAFDTAGGTVVFTEASPKKRASLHVVRGEGALEPFDRRGLEVLESDLATFRSVLTRENHTLKRALTDPRLFSGIGNAYSDEILHAARLSPLKWTSRLSSEESERLFRGVRNTLTRWIEILRAETGTGFPETVTAFRPAMAVHGKFGKPCPECGAPVQRIVYAENECNYCPGCQTEGKLLRDRSLSRLLRSDWPRDLTALEERKREDPARD